MNSPHSGKPMPLKTSEAYLDFKGESFKINYVYYECLETKERYTNEDLDKINLHQAYEQYAEKHNLPIEQVKLGVQD
jgi:hypothetical protein